MVPTTAVGAAIQKATARTAVLSDAWVTYPSSQFSFGWIRYKVCCSFCRDHL